MNYSSAIIYNGADFFNFLEAEGYNVNTSKILDSIRYKSISYHTLRGVPFNIAEVELSISVLSFKELCLSKGHTQMSVYPSGMFSQLILTNIKPMLTPKEVLFHVKSIAPSVTKLTFMTDHRSQENGPQMCLAEFKSFLDAKNSLKDLTVHSSSSSLLFEPNSEKAIWAVPGNLLNNYFFQASRFFSVSNTSSRTNPFAFKEKLEEFGKIVSLKKFATRFEVHFESELPLNKKTFEFEGVLHEFVALKQVFRNFDKYKESKKICIPQQFSVENKKRLVSIFTENSTYLLEALKAKSENVLSKQREERRRKEKALNTKREREDDKRTKDRESDRDRRDVRESKDRRESQTRRDSNERDYRPSKEKDSKLELIKKLKDSGLLSAFNELFKQKKESESQQSIVNELRDLLNKKQENDKATNKPYRNEDPYKIPAYSTGQSSGATPHVSNTPMVNPQISSGMSIPDANALAAYYRMLQPYDPLNPQNYASPNQLYGNFGAPNYKPDEKKKMDNSYYYNPYQNSNK